MGVLFTGSTSLKINVKFREDGKFRISLCGHCVALPIAYLEEVLVQRNQALRTNGVDNPNLKRFYKKKQVKVRVVVAHSL